MIGLDVMLIGAIKTASLFVMDNKLIFLIGYHLLYRMAKNSETTVDDKILTFIKNTFLKAFKMDAKVMNDLSLLKEAGLENKKIDKKAIIEYLEQKKDREGKL